MTKSSRSNEATAGQITHVFHLACVIGFPLIGLALVLGFAVPFFFDDLPERMLVAKLTFVSLGLLFAIFQLFLGVLLALLGISVEYDMDTKLGPAALKLASASPGILLIVCSNLLFGFALMREFEVKLQSPVGSSSASTETTESNKKQFAVEPLSGDNGP